MERRDFLRAGVAGVAAVAAGRTALSEDGAEGADVEALSDEERRLAPACGLFCGACSEYKKGSCHGCGCDCGKCIGSQHCSHCAIYTCAKQRGLSSCAACREFACTELILHAHDPIWRTHAPCLDNLRRRKAIGTKAWIAEQRQYWADEDRLRKSHFVEGECQAMVRKLKRKTGYKKPW